LNPHDDHHAKPWETDPPRPADAGLQPGGAGKTSLSRRLVADYAGMTSVHLRHHPRAPPGGIRGAASTSSRPAAVREMIAAGELLEWAEVNGQLYGTPRRR
jgi:guanylate kinase